MKRECENCGYSYEENGTDRPIPCPQCGHKVWIIDIILEDKMELPRDEFSAESRTTQGRLVGVREGKDDGTRTASLAHDAGKTLKVSATQLKRLDGFEEEGRVAHEFAETYNSLHNTHYAIQPKDKEDYDCDDRVLASSADDPSQIRVQVTNLDTDSAADLGKEGHFAAERNIEKIVKLVALAIERKAGIDRQLKAETILLLVTSYPLGELALEEIRADAFNFRGFMDVWTCPFRETPFPLKPCPAE